PLLGTVPLGEPDLAARDDDRAAADLDTLDLGGGAGRTRVEPRGSPHLDALLDLDLLPGFDPTVTQEMHRERACGGAGRRILEHAARRREHPCLPAIAALRREAVNSAVHLEQ